MYHKHSPIPTVKIRGELILRPSEKAKVCMNCKLDDKNCSYRCKRYKEELAKLKQGGSGGDSNGNET